jgi:hypothetical protein
MTTPEGEGLHLPMANRLPVGPGSRGGRWHEREYRNEYQRAWRAAHPEYRERERLRRARARRPDDPVALIEVPGFPRPMPEPATSCGCPCGCSSTVPTICGFCRQGIHEDAS